MTWRPWVIASLLVLAALVNGTLLYFEVIPSRQVEQGETNLNERLKNLTYIPGNRRANFQAMGMDVDLAEATASNFNRFSRQREKFERLLDEQAPELSRVLCPAELPQPYGAMSILVYEENGVRRVVDPATLRQFEHQKWFDASLVYPIYNAYERTPNRRAEATIMGVSAALLGMEEDALEGRSPFSSGVLGSWGFSNLSSQQPRVRQLVIEYFSLMHFLTELANTGDGICA
ncbi:MAG: hypothetical protein R3F59_01050 [Myxococcota bacterium]